jgi:hypothetical protein
MLRYCDQPTMGVAKSTDRGEDEIMGSSTILYFPEIFRDRIWHLFSQRESGCQGFAEPGLSTLRYKITPLVRNAQQSYGTPRYWTNDGTFM